MDNLQYYLQVDVLDAVWQRFTATARSCRNFEHLVTAHERCIASLCIQCFLQAGSVLAAFHNFFRLCLALCRLLSYGESGIHAEAACRSQYTAVSKEFTRLSAFLMSVLSNLATPQSSPGLTPLLLRLNFNSLSPCPVPSLPAASAPAIGS